MGNNNIHDIDLLKVSYEAARSEVNTRIRVRAQIIGFYLAVSLAMMGFMIKSLLFWEVTVAISLASLGFSFMVYHQNICIGIANKFCQDKVKPLFSKTPMWGNCYADRTLADLRRNHRFASQLSLILLPPISSAWVSVSKSASIEWLSLIVSILLVIAAIKILISSKNLRRGLYVGND